MHQSNQQVLLHLSLIAGLGPAKALKILQCLCKQSTQSDIARLRDIHTDYDFAQVYDYRVQDIVKIFGLPEQAAQNLVEGLAERKRLEDELYLMERHGVRLVTLLDQEYPELLAHIHLPPLVFYVHGQSLGKARTRLAMVGSRDMSEYGQQVISRLAPELVHAGFDIVSGGAYGVDSAVHQATCDAGGRTIVVLGSGVLNPYPRSNKNLFKRVVENDGSIISALPLYAEPERFNFPARNRIISGLSQGTVVVQAAQKSGSLITAKYALEQGRHVFAVPGSVYDQRSVGCHNLIKQGAVLVHDACDITREFGIDVQPVNSSIFEQETKKIKMSVEQPSVEVETDDPILKHCVGSMSVDELHEKTGLDRQMLHDKLFELQLEGKIKQNFIGGWERV